ncbi:MAG TPA: helix-turn-helix domain-containing protein [Kofleriaceae bacterium]|jgi:AcrR family transcriptional regulator
MPAAYASDEKRTVLVQSAKRLLHEQGFARTTLADVAARAGVPLGNVYYYFKTKDAIAEAVIAAHELDLRAMFSAWTARHRDPRRRLRRLVRAPLDSSSIIQFGCPHGSLCQELEKLGARAPLAKAAARLFEVYLEFAEQQFRSVGLTPREARARATDLVASIQGTMLLAHTMRSRELLASQLKRVERWLDASLPDRSPS